MILPGCTLGHIHARYVLQGYLMGIFFGHRWALFFHLAQRFHHSDEPVVSEMQFEDVIMLPKAREDVIMLPKRGKTFVCAQ